MYRLWCVCLLVVIGPIMTFAQNECGIFNQSSSVQDLTSFLRSSLIVSPEQRDVACIEFALRHLEYKSSEQTAELLVRYLDFERPLSDAERQGFMIHGPMTEANMHPAIGTLSTLGQTAIPALLSVIADPPSERTCRHATQTLIAVFRDEPAKAIEILEERSLSSAEPSAKKFKVAAEKAVQWCDKQHRQQCESVLRAYSQ